MTTTSQEPVQTRSMREHSPGQITKSESNTQKTMNYRRVGPYRVVEVYTSSGRYPNSPWKAMLGW